MDAILETDQTVTVTVDELADYMNFGWPGEDWYLDGCNDYQWEQTFTQGMGKEIYRARRPGTIVHLHDFEASVRWQGYGPDPTRGKGESFITLFLRWKQQRPEQVLVVQVPTAKLDEIAAYLKAAGCSFNRP